MNLFLPRFLATLERYMYTFVYLLFCRLKARVAPVAAALT